MHSEPDFAAPHLPQTFVPATIVQPFQGSVRNRSHTSQQDNAYLKQSTASVAGQTCEEVTEADNCKKSNENNLKKHICFVLLVPVSIFVLVSVSVSLIFHSLILSLIISFAIQTLLSHSPPVSATINHISGNVSKLTKSIQPQTSPNPPFLNIFPHFPPPPFTIPISTLSAQ